MKKIRHYFASALTSTGFTNELDKINRVAENSYVYVIKGSSGSGKSTMMKRIAQHFFDCGDDLEFFHCSSDCESLDGIRLPKYNISMVDGTSPHVIDVSLPKVNGEIVNVGQFAKNKLYESRKLIEQFVLEKTDYFMKVYGYLNICGDIFSQDLLISSFSKSNNIEALVSEYEEKMKLDNQNKLSNVRTMFISCLEKEGKMSFDNKNNFKNVLKIEEGLFDCYLVIEKLEKIIISLGYDVILFKEILDKRKTNAILVEELDLYICINSPMMDVRLNSYLRAAGKNLGKARKIHMKIEKEYIKNIDFSQMTSLTEQIIKDIENRILRFQK